MNAESVKYNLEYEKMKAMSRLLSELEKGRISGEQDGWLQADEVFRDLEASQAFSAVSSRN